LEKTKISAGNKYSLDGRCVMPSASIEVAEGNCFYKLTSKISYFNFLYYQQYLRPQIHEFNLHRRHRFQGKYKVVGDLETTGSSIWKNAFGRRK